MNPRLKSSLLWGLVGGMAFLVLVQGYHLVGGKFVGVTPMVVGGLGVLATTTALAHLVRPRRTALAGACSPVSAGQGREYECQGV